MVALAEALESTIGLLTWVVVDIVVVLKSILLKLVSIDGSDTVAVNWREDSGHTGGEG